MRILGFLVCTLLWAGSSSFLHDTIARGRDIVHASLRYVSSMSIKASDWKRAVAMSSSAAEFQSQERHLTTMATQRRGEISPYYRRDRHDNSTAPFPAPQVLSRLLQLRWQAKQEKDTAKVRAMDTQLRTDHGIYVYDSPPIWTRQTEPPFTRWRKQAAARRNKRKDMYGPRGHPLQRVGNSIIDDDMTCTISEPVIHELLSQWIVYHTRHGEAQRERARAICFELLLHGIRINATNLEWTTDSQYVFCEKTRHDTNDTAVSKRFRKDKGQTILWSFSEEDAKRRQRIEYLVERCLEARLTGKQQEKIFIEWELQHCYGVQWNRQNQTWFADKPTKIVVNHDDVALLQALSTVPLQSQCVSPPLVFYQDASIWNSPAYAQSATSLELGSAVANRVQCLVQERIHKREESKYIEADAIRKELWDTYRVGVNDRLQQYSVGGYFEGD